MDNIDYLISIDNWDMIYSIMTNDFYIGNAYIYLEACYRKNRELFKKECINFVDGKTEMYDMIYNNLKKKGWYETCFEFTKIIYKLFENNWKILYDLLYLSNVLSKKDEGFMSSDILLLNRNIPDNIRRKVLIMKQGFNISPFINRKRLIFPILYPFRPMNLFIIKKEEGYYGILRTVNYLIDNDGSYKYDGMIISENFVIRLDNKYDLISYNKIKDDNMYGSLEDCKLIDDNTFMCYLREKGIMALCKFNNNNINNMIPLKLHNDNRIEKNWIPIIDKNLYIYSYFPFIIINIDSNYICKISKYIEWSLSFEGFKGSSNFIEYNNGYLTVIHYCSRDIGVRSYYHRLIWFDSKFESGLVSPSFTFENKQIEFCLSINFKHDMKHLIFTYSIYDDKTSICELPIENIDSLLSNYFEKI